jgi:hypothetical protein
VIGREGEGMKGIRGRKAGRKEGRGGRKEGNKRW